MKKSREERIHEAIEWNSMQMCKGGDIKYHTANIERLNEHLKNKTSCKDKI